MPMDVTYLLILKRLLLSVLLGGIIGLEREVHERPAGLRTNIIVCLASALITLTSIYAFPNSDPTRIASAIVTGIGFLGAGIILQSKEKVKGLTSAATVWVVAGIGIAVGSGFYFGAIITTLIVFIFLTLKKLDVFFGA